MEKQRNFKRNRFIFGLLILLCTVLNAAPRITPSQIRELKISPVDNQNFITGKEIKFSLVIPTINPVSIDITNPHSTQDVLFKTLRKTADQDNGTKIELWYEFQKSGFTSPEPLELRISGRIYKIPFEQIQIEEDPANLKPVMVILFENGKSVSTSTTEYAEPIFNSSVSKNIKFTVYIQYSTQVLNFDYDIPKKALLRNTKTYEITEIKFRERSYSHNLIPVADFEWTPLVRGNISIPDIKLKVTSYDGLQIELHSPKAFVKISQKISSFTKDKESSIFKDSFADAVLEITPEMEEATLEELISQIEIQRKNYLKWLFVCLSIMVLIIVLFLILKVKKPHPYIIISVLALCLMIIFCSLYKKAVCVYTGGTVSSIPELQAGKHLQLSPNTEVKIVKETAEWYCIQNNENVGWTLKKNIKRY